MSLQDSQSEQEGSVAPSALVKKAAAAMAVGVGSFKDPDQLQVCSLQAASGQNKSIHHLIQCHVHSNHRHRLLIWMFICWVSEWQCTMQGLSHYLEHMLFMGSKKYPDENEYDSYLTKHGGSSNAFTELVRSLATCT